MFIMMEVPKRKLLVGIYHIQALSVNYYVVGALWLGLGMARYHCQVMTIVLFQQYCSF